MLNFIDALRISDNSKCDEAACFDETSSTIATKNVEMLEKQVLPKYFNHNQLQKFEKSARNHSFVVSSKLSEDRKTRRPDCVKNGIKDDLIEI